ncbi:MAG: POTRA domain-containing protein [Ginsengibacter sp.]
MMQSVVAFAQDSASLKMDSGKVQMTKMQIKNIVISGNKKTKRFVILREMHIREGDSILVDNITSELEKAKVYIYNTTLFSEVDVLPLIQNPKELDILIVLKEKWYFLPIPHLELADRSFNEWVKTHHADFKRLSYGLRFSHQNFSGRGDELSINLINGFKRNLSIDYSIPYLNSALTKGLKIGGGISQTKEIPFASSVDNKLLYYENGGYEKAEKNIKASLTFRKGLRLKGTFSIDLRNVTIADTIISTLNPKYFNSTSKKQTFVDIEYLLKYDHVDNVMYPLKGNSFSLSVKKRGLEWSGGINRFSVEPGFQTFFKHKNDWYSSIRLSAEIKLPFDQPYYNLQALGYRQNYMRGYEYHVVDGVAFGLSKFDLKKKIGSFDLPTMFRTRIVDKIPFTFYAKTFTDLGYVYHKESSKLGNRFLYSGGFGIDILTLFDLKISLEYSLNQLGQKGVFLHN